MTPRPKDTISERYLNDTPFCEKFGGVMSNHRAVSFCWRPGFLPVDSSAANNTDFLTSSSTWWPGDAVLLFVASKTNQLLATASHLKQYKHNINDTYTKGF